MKYVLGVLVLLVGMAAGLYVFVQYTANTQTRAGVFTAQEFVWGIEDVSSADAVQPSTRISLHVGGTVQKDFLVGVYNLSCHEQNTDLLENELSKVTCWWGGGGNELGIFKEGGHYVVKEGTLDEGDAQHDGSRSNFKTLFTVQ